MVAESTSSAAVHTAIRSSARNLLFAICPGAMPATSSSTISAAEGAACAGAAEVGVAPLSGMRCSAARRVCTPGAACGPLKPLPFADRSAERRRARHRAHSPSGPATPPHAQRCGAGADSRTVGEIMRTPLSSRTDSAVAASARFPTRLWRLTMLV